YEGRVKCIYIDPPYNTGNEGWVYNDNVNDPRLKKWLGEVVGKESEDLTRHDKWLCMMYPRLQLLRKLLRKDGVVFISINDVEIASLRFICDEIFGAKNFVNQLIWNSEGNTDNQLEIKVNHEYILMYVKDIAYKTDAIGRVVDPNTREDSNLWKGIADNNINKNNPANPPEIVTLPIGFPCTEKTLFYEGKQLDESFFSTTKKEKKVSDKVKAQYGIENLSGMPVKLDNLTVKDHKLTKECRVYGGFANRLKLEEFIGNGCQPIHEEGIPISFYLNKNAAIRYRKEIESPRNILSVLKNFGTTEKTKTELKKAGIDFSYPKPVDLIKYLVSFGAQPKDSIVLDSFAGSGTTAHAVIKLNAEDEGNRTFILIQLDEYNKEGVLVNVCEDVTTARVKTAINTYRKEGLECSGFDYYDLGHYLFNGNGLNDQVSLFDLRQYIYYAETKQALPPTPAKADNAAFLARHDDTAYYFHYEPDAVTTLNHDFLATMRTRAGQYIIYADNCLLTQEFMTQHGIIFKKIPRDISRF
ncbi:MAG: site-specific DNA-methyltransferase, partial [Hymenobacter sp.]